MYDALIKRQVIKISNDKTKKKMGKRILLKISRGFEEKIKIPTFFMAGDNSL